MARSPPVPNRLACQGCRAGRALVLTGVLLSLPAAERVAGAGEPAKTPAAIAAESPIHRAERLFNVGVSLFKARDYERALPYFKRSLGEVPSSHAAMNAAFCLDKLELYGEAMEMSEELLTTFAAELTPAERQAIEANVAIFSTKTGSIRLTSNVGGRVTIDGRDRGELPQEGSIRVNVGEHTVRVSKEGFERFEERTKLVTVSASIHVQAVLKPIVPVVIEKPPARPYPFFEAFAGYAISGSLASTAEGSDVLLSHPPVSGFVGGVRGGYRLGMGLAFELSLGYLYAVSEFHHTVPNPFFNDPSRIDIRYDLGDTLQIRGSFLGMGASYRIAFGERLAFLWRTTIGVLSASVKDTIAAKVATDGPTIDATVQNNGQGPLSSPAFVMPEVGVEAGWGGFHASVHLGLVIVTADGPSFTGRKVHVDPSGCPGSPTGSVACVPIKPLGDPNRPPKVNDLAYGKFVLWVPQVVVGYSF